MTKKIGTSNRKLKKLGLLPKHQKLTAEVKAEIARKHQEAEQKEKERRKAIQEDLRRFEALHKTGIGFDTVAKALEFYADAMKESHDKLQEADAKMTAIEEKLQEFPDDGPDVPLDLPVAALSTSS